MIFSRMTAAICVVLLIGLVALASIGITSGIGTALTHGNNVEHSNGYIQPGYLPGQPFQLLVKNGPLLRFQCQQRCLTETAHIQRHLNEHAPTDVYYLREPNNTLVAIDVD